jgi:hypothetical protein
LKTTNTTIEAALGGEAVVAILCEVIAAGHQ